MTDQLDDFLEQGTSDEVEPVELTETDDKALDATPETADNEEAPAAPEGETKGDDKEPETIAMSAYMGQKRELQEAKRQLESLKTPEVKEEVDIFEDPEKFKNNVISDAQQIALNSRFETSEMIMQDKHGDYDEKADKFELLVKDDASLYNQLVNSRNPAKFLYDHVVKTEKLGKVDNIDAYEAKIAELESKLAGIETGGKVDKVDEKLPPSMVDVRSSSAPKVADQEYTLDNILNG